MPCANDGATALVCLLRALPSLPPFFPPSLAPVRYRSPPLTFCGSRTDEFFQLTIGRSKQRSRVVSNSLNPSWSGPDGHVGQPLYLGMHASGTSVHVEAWDRDTGLEFDDDPIGKAASFRVPRCWSGSATWQTAECVDGGEYSAGKWRRQDCRARSSLWEMEDYKACSATIWVNLATGGGSVDSWLESDDPQRAVLGEESEVGCGGGRSGADPCLQLQITVVPLTVEVTSKFAGSLEEGMPATTLLEEGIHPFLDREGLSIGGDRTLNKDYAKRFDLYGINSGDQDPFIAGTELMDNALLLQTYDSDRSLPHLERKTKSADLLEVTANLPCEVLICPYGKNDELPGFVKHDGWKQIDNCVIQLEEHVGDAEAIFNCFVKRFAGTRRNRYGGMDPRTALLLGTNDPSASSSQFNYIVLFQGDTQSIKADFVMKFRYVKCYASDIETDCFSRLQ